MQYQVKLVDIAEEFSLEQIYLPENIDEIYVRRSDVSRPGLPLAGYFEYFENGRIQMIGNMEHGYLSSLGAEARFKALDDYLSHDVVAVVVTTSLDIFPELYTLVQKHDTPLYRTTWPTSEFMAALISSLSVSLAERITRHGVLVEVYGEGILMLGDSGIGKSETAIELVKRGHRLIADDAQRGRDYQVDGGADAAAYLRDGADGGGYHLRGHRDAGYGGQRARRRRVLLQPAVSGVSAGAALLRFYGDRQGAD